MLVLKEVQNIDGQVNEMYPIPPLIIAVFCTSVGKVANLEVVAIIGKDGRIIPRTTRMM